MSTQTAEPTLSISSLSGISDAPLFRGVVPVTKEEEGLVQQKMKDKQDQPESNDKGVVVGDLLSYEKALLIRSMVITMEIEEEKRKLKNPLVLLFGAMHGNKEDSEAIRLIRSKSDRRDQLRELLWIFVNERFSEALTGERVIGLRVDHNFQVVTVIGDESLERCPGCGGYHE